MKKASQLGIATDYIPVPCQNVQEFITWLITFLGAEVLANQDWNAKQMLIKIPGVGVCKVFNAEVYNLPPSYHLPIKVNSIEEIIAFMQSLNVMCQGEKHWRVFTVRGLNGAVLGHIHAAERDKPLG